MNTRIKKKKVRQYLMKFIHPEHCSIYADILLIVEEVNLD
jgi:hypothetical protein